MRSKSFENMTCSIAGALEAIGDRWAVLILRDLMLGLSKYEDLRRSTGVTHATLSDRLKHLEDKQLLWEPILSGRLSAAVGESCNH
jgi:DNA-binding HxlR family transcriptional regulator